MDFQIQEDIRHEKLVLLLDRLIKKGNTKQYNLFFQKYHEADIAEALVEFPKVDRLKFFRTANPELAAEVLEELETEEQIKLILELKTELAAKFIEEMEADDAVDLLEELLLENEEEAEKILEALPKEDAADIKELLAYKEDSAGAIMNPEFLSIPENLTVAQALIRFKKLDPPTSEVSFYIFVVNEENKLVGYTTLRNLVMTPANTDIKEIRKEYQTRTYIDMDQEEVARIFQKYDYVILPVVDHDDVLVGVITVDDIVDVVVEEATEDIYKLSGTGDIEEAKLISGKLIYSIKSRLPWLALTIIGGIIASFLITTYSGSFRPKIFSLALSLSFVPMLMGLGGNVGNQSATIIVRGISTGQVKDKQVFKYILRESLVGFFIGFIISVLVFLYVFFSFNSNLFALIVAASLIANITVAAFIGSALPIILRKCSVDPAVASAPFISSALDIIGQLIYFALTLWVLSHIII
jgi:magnesium transporter